MLLQQTRGPGNVRCCSEKLLLVLSEASVAVDVLKSPRALHREQSFSGFTVAVVWVPKCMDICGAYVCFACTYMKKHQ